jgi:hypothetical protein
MSMTASTTPSAQQESAQAERGNATTSEIGIASVSERENREIRWPTPPAIPRSVFIHGLWLLPSSWVRAASEVSASESPRVSWARVEAAGDRPEPLSDGFLVRDPWHTAVAFVAHDQDEQARPNKHKGE